MNAENYPESLFRKVAQQAWLVSGDIILSNIDSTHIHAQTHTHTRAEQFLTRWEMMYALSKFIETHFSVQLCAINKSILN